MPAKEVGFDVKFEERVTFLNLKAGEKAKVAFIENVPGKDSPVTQVTQHYITEKEGSKYIMCTGGLCCQIMTWNNFEKDYTLSKAKTVYWVPIVMYYPDPETMEPTAGVGILPLNFYQFKKLAEQINSIEPGTLPFFQRDITVSFDKNGTYNDFAFIRSEKKAMWLENPKMKAIIEDQLQTLADDIQSSLPVEYTETELAAKIEEWNKVKQQHAQEDEQVQQGASEVAYTTAQAAAPAEPTTVPPSIQAQQATIQQAVETVTVPATPVQQAVETVTTEAEPEITLAALQDVLNSTKSV